MSAQDVKRTAPPEWANGLTEEQKAVVRREAVSRGITPAELVAQWVIELAKKLTEGRDAA